MTLYNPQEEKSACGVGFIANLEKKATHQILKEGLKALSCQEHRGGRSADQQSSDGSGIMTDIPYEMLGYQAGKIAVATLFAPKNIDERQISLRVFEDTFDFLELEILEYRRVPINVKILGKDALANLPYILQAVIKRPEHCTTNASFDKLLYTAKQFMRIKQKQKQIPEIYFPSLSANTIVYKALTLGENLDKFYLDLQNPQYKTRFTLFHRRFSTNTKTSWDKAQPFRMIGHNGEFNTITSNRSWAKSREKAMGLYKDELLVEKGISDSGSLNEMVEALKYRTSIPRMGEIMALLMPPAQKSPNNYYKFWRRAMEPWDGPALISYSNGRSLGARLDRNGFRPCRWAKTNTHFYLSSEAGSFEIDEALIEQKGSLHAGTGVHVNLETGEVDFTDPSLSQLNIDANFDARTFPLPFKNPRQETPKHLDKKYLFSYTQEDLSKILVPMIEKAKEPIGSMGDTARLAVLSEEPRSFYDYFYHNFAQVTNPPLDYLREKIVTDLTVYLGKHPNIFAKKDLIPAPVALELQSPILSLGQMEYLDKVCTFDHKKSRIVAQTFSTTFLKEFGTVGFKQRLRALSEEVDEAIESGVSIIILSDKDADERKIPIPMLLAVGAVIEKMRNTGFRLKFSLVIHSAEIRTTHQIATTIGMGATAVCPYLTLEIARFSEDKKLAKFSAEEKEQNLIKAYEGGLLKIMAKMGISVLRSYQSSKLFTSVGISEELINKYFKGVKCLLSGIGLEQIVEDLLRNIEKSQEAKEGQKLLNTYQFKEQARGKLGEKHSMTAKRSKMIHELVRNSGKSLDNIELYQEYLNTGTTDEPITVRHLFSLKEAKEKPDLSEIQANQEITQKFGSGAMSFGALSAEAQRDIFKAMRAIGGRSNSGEGGENPYYYTEGISATCKQVASGRFGVNALYLVSGQEIQIKIAQGAKPGEGGQLMGIKVDEHIAKARNALKGVDLISPPPLHDIYSIEDLKQLIYELKQLKPHVKVNVKLVSGAGIGTIAVGVAKAGADIIHISGGEGGTGAASLSSMKHAGLPWEFGLLEVHQALLANGLRKYVKLRADGGLHTGREVLMATLLGAEEYDFGKILLIAQGCIMARVCEKNACPTGIATHNPRFKAKYKGNAEHIAQMMQYIAEDVRYALQEIGAKSLEEVVGKTEFLMPNPKAQSIIKKKNLDLSFALKESYPYNPNTQENTPFSEGTNALNAQVLADCQNALNQNEDIALTYPINTLDRAVATTLSGEIAKRQDFHFKKQFQSNGHGRHYPIYEGKIKLTFEGSAGQGFGAFLLDNVDMKLYGEANDSVGKTMSGGKIVIVPSKKAKFEAEQNVIIGNCALYGATGGTVYIKGWAGDRFAVRNSGATAVVEGVGLHACEYMTQGKVVILGETSLNIGGGMTGGEVITYGEKTMLINHEYLKEFSLEAKELKSLKLLLEDYFKETASKTAQKILENWASEQKHFYRYLPHQLVLERNALKNAVKSDYFER